MGRVDSDPPTHDSTAAQRSLGFTFRLADGAGKLTLSNRTLFDAVHLDRLELEVPNLALPIDLTAGPEKFQRRRTRVRLASLRVNQRDLDQFVAGCGPALAELGVDELRVRGADGYLGVAARIRDGAQVAELTARIYLVGEGPMLRFAVDEARVYGFLPTPAPLLAHRLAAAMVRGFDTGPAATTQIRGLGDFELDALSALLWHTMPRAGWRLPDLGSVQITAANANRGALSISYTVRGDADEQIVASVPEALDLLLELERFRDADEQLRAGQVDSAMRAYRGELAARGPEQPFLVSRILAVASARREFFVDGTELARQALGRWPDFAPAHSAIAAIAVAQGDSESAAARYQTLADMAAAIGDDEATARAALSGARLLRHMSPGESTAMYERVLEHRPTDSEAAEALAERYTDEQRWHDLARLIRSRLASTTDPVRQARDHVRLAKVLSRRLGDLEGARIELERACELDPSSALGFEALADVIADLGDIPEAVDALDIACNLYAERRDHRSEARAHLRAAEQWEALGDDVAAQQRYHRALDRIPNLPEAVRGAARAAARRGLDREAAELWKQLIAVGTEVPSVQASYYCEYGRSLLACGNLEEAQEALDRAARIGDADVSADAHALLARMYIDTDRASSAAVELAAAIGALIDSNNDEETSPRNARARAAALSLQRAELLVELSQGQQALADFARAFDLSDSDSPERAVAAQALLADARARGDTEAQRRWLDALLGTAIPAEDRSELLLSRVRLVVEQGRIDPNALDDIDTALAAATSSEQRTEALILKSELLIASGDALGRARALAERADLAKSVGDRIDATIDAAEAWLAAEENDEALAMSRKAVAAIENADDESTTGGETGRKTRALAALGESAWRRRAWDEVNRAYAPLLELDSTTAGAIGVHGHRLGIARDKRGDVTGAVAAFELVVADGRAPGDVRAGAWRHLAGLYERIGDLSKAARAFESFAADDVAEVGSAARADAWYRAGELYRKLENKNEDAERCLEQALHIVGDHLPALDALERIKRFEQDWDRVAVILGRKIAATSRHPNRQKSLLARLAALQEETLGRKDVARVTYARALEIDPEFRPALRFTARDCLAEAHLMPAADAYNRLARDLPSDVDLPDDVDAIAAEKIDAAVALSSIYVERGGDEVIAAERVIAALEENLAQNRKDVRLLAALESVQRSRADWRALADVLARRAAAAIAPQDSLEPDLERIEILANRLEDLGAAMAAARAAITRNSDSDQLREIIDQLDAQISDPQAAPTDPSSDDLRDFEALLDTARNYIDDGDHADAIAMLEGYATASAPDELLALRAEAFEAAQDWARHAVDLQELCARAAAERDIPTERRLTRRLAAIFAEHLRDSERAVERYERALALDPDDLASAEAVAQMANRRGDHQGHIDGLLRVLDIARRTGAGDAVVGSTLLFLAREARRAGDLESAARFLEQAHVEAPGDAQIVRDRAELAEQLGDFEGAARSLELLLDNSGAQLGRHTRGELHLQLADIYYDELEDVLRARLAMHAAAEAFGSGSRGDATLRLLASEASAAGAHAGAARAYESMGAERLTDADRLGLAKAYQRLGREQQAIGVLEQSRTDGALDDEGTLLLFALYRQRKRKEDLAASLERGAAQAPAGIAATRLLEALNLYETSLSDVASAKRVRERLTQLAETRRGKGGGDGWLSPLPDTPAPEDLERAAEAAAAGDDAAVAADLLARAVVERTKLSGTLDGTTIQVLENLRDLANRSGHHAAHVRGLLSASAVANDRTQASSLLREAAALRRTHLHDLRGAADTLSRALALTPQDTSLLDEIDATLREAGDYSQLVSAYELHLGSVQGRVRAPALVDLARIYRDVFREPERARAYMAEAIELAPEIEHQIADELEESGHTHASADMPEVDPRPDIDVDATLAAAAQSDREGDISGAIELCELAAAADPDDTRALRDLERLYGDIGDMDALSEVLGRLTVAIDDRAERAELWYRRAQLYKDVLHREPEAYRCLKEAFANDPGNSRVASSLRNVAMARGEWALAAELLYREITSAPNDIERGALYLELAMIYDQKLLDPEQAVKNYEQSIELDPEIPAAPRPLARLYELDGQHRDAARMYELAAAHARDEDLRAKLLRHAAMNAERIDDAEGARRLYSLAAVMADSDDSRAAQAAIARLSSPAGDAAERLNALETQLSNTSEMTTRLELLREALEMSTAAGDTGAIERHARALLQANSGDLPAYLALKSRAAADRDWHTVAQLLSTRAQSIVDADERAALYFELGRAYEADLGDANAAIGAYEEALAADPDHPGALQALAESSYHRQDWLRARELYERLRPDRCSLPADVIAFRRGEIAEVLGRDSEAAEAFGEAVRLFPSNRQSLAALIRTALRVGDHARAIRAVRALLELLPPEDIDAITAARLQLAELSHTTGDEDTAIQYFELVLREEPGCVPAQTSLVELYQKRGDHSGSSRAMRALIGLSPGPAQRADLLYHLAEIYRTGVCDEDLAADAYLKAIDLDPGHLPTLRRLIDYYWRIGDLVSLDELTRELHAQGGLTLPETEGQTAGRAIVTEALIGLADLAIGLAEKLGDSGAALLAEVLVDAAERGLASNRDLAAAGARVVAGSGLDGAAVFEKVSELASFSQSATALLTAIGEGR